MRSHRLPIAVSKRFAAMALLCILSLWAVAAHADCGDGVVDAGEQCDLGAQNGSDSCCDESCQLRTAGAVCRPADGVCDAAETCDGVAAACPADEVLPTGTECRARDGAADLAEVCNGTTKACPPDAGLCAGWFDAGFGGGVVTEGTPGDYGSLEGILEQPDRKVVGAGWVGDNVDFLESFSLIRYLPDGRLDPDFGDGGSVRTIIGTYSYSYDIGRQSDGKLLVVGESLNPDAGWEIVLARYHDDGSLDTGFGNGGVVRMQLDAVSALWRLLVREDDSILAVVADLGSHVSVIAFHPNGTIDGSFGSAGVATYTLASGGTGLPRMALQPDGKVVVAVTRFPGGAAREVLLVRFHADGSVDTDFGTDGATITGVAHQNVVAGLVVLPDGKIVVGGESREGFDLPADATLWRFHADGSLDLDFGVDGAVVAPRDGISADIRDVTRLADGRIVLAGSNASSTMLFAVFEDDGSPAADFGDDGFLVESYGSSSFINRAIVAQGGKLVGVGYGHGWSTFLAARIHTRCARDAYVAYRAKAPRSDLTGTAIPDRNQLPKPWAFTIDDLLLGDATDNPENLEAGTSQHLLLAARVDGEPPADNRRPYIRYRAKAAKESVAEAVNGRFPKPAKHAPRLWQLQNRFGTVNVTSRRVSAVLVPAAADGDATPVAPGDADHFVCYGVKATRDITEQTPDGGRGTGRFRRDLQAFFADDFDFCALAQDGEPGFAGTSMEGQCLLNLTGPTELCNPVHTSEVEPPRSSAAAGIDAAAPLGGESLLCYKVRLASKHTDAAAAARVGAEAGARLNPKPSKAAPQSVRTGNPLYTTPGGQFPYPVLLDLRGQALACLPTYIISASPMP